MKNHFRSNILLYIAMLGSLGFIPILADAHVNQFNIIALTCGIGWLIAFLLVWLLNNYFCFKFKNCRVANKWIKSEEFTGYFKFYRQQDNNFKVGGIPCTILDVNTVFVCHTDIIHLHPELANEIYYVKKL